jgi:hypothetical protein
MRVCVNSVEIVTASKQKVLTACFKYLVKSNGLRDYMLLKIGLSTLSNHQMISGKSFSAEVVHTLGCVENKWQICG